MFITSEVALHISDIYTFCKHCYRSKISVLPSSILRVSLALFLVSIPSIQFGSSSFVDGVVPPVQMPSVFHMVPIPHKRGMLVFLYGSRPCTWVSSFSLSSRAVQVSLGAVWDELGGSSAQLLEIRTSVPPCCSLGFH